MSATLRPGDVVLNRGVVGMVAKSQLEDYGDMYLETSDGRCLGMEDVDSDFQLLVTFNPEDHDEVGKLRRAIANSPYPGLSVVYFDDVQSALRSLRDAPRGIPEPGPWGVVEAGCSKRSDRHEWVRHGDTNGWWSTRLPGLTFPFDELIDPVLVREGVDE